MDSLKVSSYSELVKKYDNFMNPAIVMTINNIPVSKLPGIYVSQANVQISLEGASAASITLEKVYDLESRSFFSTVKSNFQLGAVITIELGYGSKTTMVFYGYIHEIHYSYSDVPSIAITALDMQKLMMLNYEIAVYHNMTYTEILQQVVLKYQGVYRSLQLDPVLTKEKTIEKKTSDYDFIQTVLCPRAKKIFYVSCGVVHFESRAKNPLPVLTLSWGESLLDFSFSKIYTNEEIVVYGVEGKKIIHIQEKVKTESSVKSLTGSPIRKEITVPETNDKQKLERIGQSEAEKIKQKSKKGSGTCIGLPELQPGRYLSIANLGVDSGVLKGYLTAVKHSFGANGFTTEFELGGD